MSVATCIVIVTCVRGSCISSSGLSACRLEIIIMSPPDPEPSKGMLVLLPPSNPSVRVVNWGMIISAYSRVTGKVRGWVHLCTCLMDNTILLSMNTCTLYMQYSVRRPNLP